MPSKAIVAVRVLVVLAALAAAAALLASGPGYQLGLWHFRTGIVLVRWSGYIGVAGAVLAVIALLVPRLRAGAKGTLAAALVLSLSVGGITGAWAERASSVPRIHDISTDTDNPPAFAAVLPLREGAENKPAYDGPEVAAEQKKGYPDIQPLVLNVPPQAAFGRARDAARELGWKMVAEDAAAGRFEASDRTLWFGFTDDIVVRVSAAGTGSRVDVRSKSRVGRSDIGTNAKRIRAFLARVKAG